MRFFALLTGSLVATLAAFAFVLPSTDLYTQGVDDGPIERFQTIAEAEQAARFDFPDAGAQRGWELEDVVVTPAYYFRRLLAEQPKLAFRPLPNQGDSTSARLWISLPEPPPGVHSYVSMAYTSDRGVVISLNVNLPISTREPVVPSYEVAEKTRARVFIGETPALVSTYTAKDVEVMATAWRVNGVRVSATAYSFLAQQTKGITQDEFVAFLNKVR